jgi:K+-transporting ATPase c subunit
LPTSPTSPILLLLLLLLLLFYCCSTAVTAVTAEALEVQAEGDPISDEASAARLSLEQSRLAVHETDEELRVEH